MAGRWGTAIEGDSRFALRSFSTSVLDVRCGRHVCGTYMVSGLVVMSNSGMSRWGGRKRGINSVCASPSAALQYWNLNAMTARTIENFMRVCMSSSVLYNEVKR